MVQIVIGQAKNNRYVNAWTFDPTRLHTTDQISELRLTSSATKKSIITIKEKLQLNNIRASPTTSATSKSSQQSTTHSWITSWSPKVPRIPWTASSRRAAPERAADRATRRPARTALPTNYSQAQTLSSILPVPLSSAYIPLLPSAAVDRYRHFRPY